MSQNFRERWPQFPLTLVVKLVHVQLRLLREYAARRQANGNMGVRIDSLQMFIGPYKAELRPTQRPLQQFEPSGDQVSRGYTQGAQVFVFP